MQRLRDLLKGAMLSNRLLESHPLQSTLAHQLNSPLTHTCVQQVLSENRDLDDLLQ